MARYRLISIVFIAIIFAGALTLLTLMIPNNNLANEITVKGTKISFLNNGTTWLHLNAIFENLTKKDGSTETYYSDIWIKPHGNVTVDISHLSGYNDEDILPSNYSFNLIAWKGLYNDTYGTNSTGNLDLNLQGYSGSIAAGSNAKITNVAFPDLAINKLPSFINKDSIFTTNDYSQLSKQLNYTQENGLYEEELITIDQDGNVDIKVIMIAKQPKMSTPASYGDKNKRPSWFENITRSFGLS